MTSPNHHYPHEHQPLGIGKFHHLGNDMTLASSMVDVARWFRDDQYGCPATHRHGNCGYPPFFQPQPPRRQDGAVSGHYWPSTVVDAAASATPWSLQLGGSPSWTSGAAGRPGYRGLDDWPRGAVEHGVSPTSTHHHHQHQQQAQQQQQCPPRSPDDVTTSLQTHKYPWMSIIGEFDLLLKTIDN